MATRTLNLGDPVFLYTGIHHCTQNIGAYPYNIIEDADGRNKNKKTKNKKQKQKTSFIL